MAKDEEAVGDVDVIVGAYNGSSDQREHALFGRGEPHLVVRHCQKTRSQPSTPSSQDLYASHTSRIAAAAPAVHSLVFPSIVSVPNPALPIIAVARTISICSTSRGERRARTEGVVFFCE